MFLNTAADSQLIGRDGQVWLAAGSPPVFSFAYDRVVLDDTRGEAWKSVGGQRIALDANEAAEVRAWVQAYDSPAPPAADANILAAEARTARDAMLAACDWRVIREIENGIPMEQAWMVYRQALRDIPSQAGFPGVIVWPDVPGGGV